jgi:hypothetical protein
MCACDRAGHERPARRRADQLALSAVAVADDAASFACSAEAAVAFSSPDGFGAVADFGAAGAPALGASEVAVGCGAGDFAAPVVPDFGFSAAGVLAAVPASGFAVVPDFDAAGFDADAVPAEADDFDDDAEADDFVPAEAVVFDTVPPDALGFDADAVRPDADAVPPDADAVPPDADGFDAEAVPADADADFDAFDAFDFAALPAFGFAVADFADVPAFGFAAVVGFEAALPVVPGFGFAAVADFGAPLLPAFGVLGLRVVVPAARVRAVRVAVGAGVPVLVPPARGAGAEVSAMVPGVSSLSLRRRLVASDTTLRPRSTTPEMRSLGLMAMAPTVRATGRLTRRPSASGRS